MGIDLDLDVEEEGWNEVYQENDRTFDNTGCGPNNIPAETTELKHFVDLFLDNEFWGNHSMYIENKEKSLGSSGKGARYLWGPRAQRVKISSVIWAPNLCQNGMEEVNRLLSIRHLTTTPYHPMCNGLDQGWGQILKKKQQLVR